tara:strand:- start:30 stop:395 length:366 start_codon:yes stop_codon:yes gene_type:complete
MASELRVNTLKDAAGNNSIATSFVASGSAKAWVNFNGSGTIAARTSLNLSSLTDNGTGDYTVNLTNSFSDEPAANITSGKNNLIYNATGNTSNIRFLSKTAGSNTNADTTILVQSVHGDLA